MRGAARYGIEHELALLYPDGSLADFAVLTHDAVAAIVDELPDFPDGQRDLRIGDAGIRRKHWYAEGYERLGDDGELARFDPKGIEIRTAVHDSAAAAGAALTAAASRLAEVARRHGLRPVAVGHHPLRSSYRLDPPPNAHERALMASSPEERTAPLHMVTWGPDLNLSFPGAGTDPAVLADAAAKLTHYSPYLVPWSFSSPFRDGRPWGGLSARTFRRTGLRPAALAYLEPGAPLLPTDPSLVRHAGIPGEIGRIEFKAFDAVPVIEGEEPAAGCGTGLPGALLSLLTGLLRDGTLPGRRRTPDPAAHRRSALLGWTDAAVRAGSRAVLAAAETALRAEPDHAGGLALLRERLERRDTPAARMLDRYRSGGGIAGVAP
ncbi:glutamate-cysteine ligase family protein [Pseudonocardia sp. HH130630-07]|uniref:glutamate-cysteine ligase family protein n=1 Tax=Pseudonocardia sp. HH130630-07 TaxID=1690815 RepID=UPI000814E3D4|nr:glutamate-cysteine ligase family protein [Pseudonocardia sp. HH130630-07]ANY05218.1 glutamate--cysteine ligase [Pseudonocardia sp. HH130630-07]